MTDDIDKVIEMVKKTIVKSGLDDDEYKIEIGKDVSDEQWKHFTSNKWIKGPD